jgi:hypothetical protein
MDKEEILSDSNLEKLKLIKEIDTLSIIYKAQVIKERRLMKLRNLATIISALLILSANLTLLITKGIRIMLIVQAIFSWGIIILFLPLLKDKLEKYYRSGGMI